uniref:glucan endo-1,3-beta-D-glucosidase n=1 Tax=Oryza barthii TaxID=65489 RepID=A0A0D3GRH0_9ORYZ
MGSRSRGGRHLLLLLLHLLSLHSSLLPWAAVSAAGGGGSGDPYVGVTIGTAVTNLLSPSDLAEFLRAQRITHVRLYDADPRMLSALASSGARAIVGVPNDELLALGSSPATASAWVARRVLHYAGANSSTPGLIAAIAVGDEVPTALPSALPVLLPAIQSLAAALAAANLSSIPVSTPLPFSVVLDPFPPSQAFFNQSLAKSFILPLLSHLANTSAPLMLNLYPYYSMMQSNGVIPLDNALFKPLPPSLEMVDPNTLLHYTNVFDAMLDAVHVAVKNLNATGGGGPVPVLVTETGWPSYGDRRAEPYATRDNADAYNSNLIKHVNDKPGTPMRPGAQASVYIYELFNEDLRPGPVSEANWGLFHGNGTPVYLLHVSGAGGFLANDTTDRTFCIASDDADEKAVQAAMDWACGPGRTDCTAIQPGQGCYEPNDVRSHASFAFDSYYQSQGKAAGSCYFQGVGMVTTTDPSEYTPPQHCHFFLIAYAFRFFLLFMFSVLTVFDLFIHVCLELEGFSRSACGHDSCIFPGSKLLSNVTKSDGANTTTAQTSDAEGSAIWRLRTGRETGFLFILRWLLSLSVVLITTNSNFWT